MDFAAQKTIAQGINYTYRGIKRNMSDYGSAVTWLAFNKRPELTSFSCDLFDGKDFFLIETAEKRAKNPISIARFPSHGHFRRTMKSEN